jgi:hypothetical protein
MPGGDGVGGVTAELQPFLGAFVFEAPVQPEQSLAVAACVACPEGKGVFDQGGEEGGVTAMSLRVSRVHRPGGCLEDDCAEQVRHGYADRGSSTELEDLELDDSLQRLVPGIDGDGVATGGCSQRPAWREVVGCEAVRDHPVAGSAEPVDLPGAVRFGSSAVLNSRGPTPSTTG